MNQLVFVTADPFDTVPRVLDHARKSAFALLEMRMTLRQDGRYLVRVSFGSAGAISFDTLAALCARLVDVGDLVHGADPDGGGAPHEARFGGARAGGQCLSA